MTRDANALFACRLPTREVADDYLRRIPNSGDYEVRLPKDWVGFFLCDRDSGTSTMRKDVLELFINPETVADFAAVGLVGSWFVWAS